MAKMYYFCAHLNFSEVPGWANGLFVSPLGTSQWLVKNGIVIFDGAANKFSLLAKSNMVSDLSYVVWVASSSSFSSRSLGAGEDAALPPSPVSVSGQLSSDAGFSTQSGSDRQSVLIEKGAKKKHPKLMPSSGNTLQANMLQLVRVFVIFFSHILLYSPSALLWWPRVW